MQHRHLLSLAAIVLVAACSSDASTAPASIDPTLSSGSGGGSGGSNLVRVSCEVRGTSRSRISVDGNNLTPLNAMYSARVTSGANSAVAPAARAIGDEVEFDFDSNRNDILQGATAISRTFIVANPAGPDVQAQLINAAGSVVATASAECTVR
jgi:hypothetical protein